MQHEDRFTEAVLRDELRRLNSHLPKHRRPLKELLKDSSPSVTSVSGHKIRMRKVELEGLSSSLPDLEPGRIRLPLVLVRRKDLGLGVYVVIGDPYEEYVVLSLANAFRGTFQEYQKETRNPAVVYQPQVSALLRRFHSLITIGFGSVGLEK